MKSVECVSFSSDSRLLCSGSWDKSAVLWNTEVAISKKSVTLASSPVTHLTLLTVLQILLHLKTGLTDFRSSCKLELFVCVFPSPVH